MTVIVTLQDGDTDQYMRYRDTYIKHYDGTLDVVRDGAKSHIATSRVYGPTYKATKKRLKRSRFQNWFKREATDSVAP